MKTVDYNVICEENKNMQYIDLYWIDENDYNATNIKDGNAYGAYGFDRRHSLVQFMKYCMEYDAVEFEAFEPFISLGSGSPKLQNNEELAAAWNNIFMDYNTDFMDLQNQYAYQNYYLLAISNCLKTGLDVDKYSSTLRGTLWFFITKFGVSSGTKKILAPFKQGITDELEALHMIFTNSTSIDKAIYDKAIESYNNHIEVANLVNDEPGKEVIEKIKAINLEESDEFEESPIVPEETVFSKTPGETKNDLKKVNDKFTDPVREAEENKITKNHIDLKVINKTPVLKNNNQSKDNNIKEKTKKPFDKKAEFKVCEDWKHGYPVNLKFASQYYDEAKEEAIKIANNTRKTIYVYGNKGQRLFMYDPKKVHPDTVNGYRVGTGILGSTILNEIGSFNKFENAKHWANISSIRDNKVYKVYLNQDLKYTSNFKVK